MSDAPLPLPLPPTSCQGNRNENMASHVLLSRALYPRSLTGERPVGSLALGFGQWASLDRQREGGEQGRGLGGYLFLWLPPGMSAAGKQHWQALSGGRLLLGR